MGSDTITREMPIGTVVKEHPETVPVFLKHGLHCIGCHVAAFESVAEGAQAHGIEVDTLMADLNEAADAAAKSTGEASATPE
jgi:hybrid cluster-associated redox disulfide protein